MEECFSGRVVGPRRFRLRALGPPRGGGASPGCARGSKRCSRKSTTVSGPLPWNVTGAKGRLGLDSSLGRDLFVELAALLESAADACRDDSADAITADYLRELAEHHKKDALLLRALLWEDTHMIFRPLAECSPGPTILKLRGAALNAAIVLRDCSFREQSTAMERRACRHLMRERALRWRHPEAAPGEG